MTQEQLEKTMQEGKPVRIFRAGLKPTPCDVGMPTRTFHRLQGGYVRTYVEVSLGSGRVCRAPLSRLRTLEAAP